MSNSHIMGKVERSATVHLICLLTQSGEGEARENVYVSLTFSSNENFYEIILKRDDFNMV